MTAARSSLDAIVVGAGPNGLAAALTLARAGRSVRVYEAAASVGGGTRTEELTLPGFRHDVCSSIVPLALASPFFRTVDWGALGVEFIQPDAPLAHALDAHRAIVLERSFTATAANLDADRRTDDGSAWRRLFGPLARDEAKLGRELLRPVIHVPRHPLALARFGLPALRSAAGLARSRFRGDAAQALFVGLAAHSMLRLDRPMTAAFGLVLGLYAHAVGWPMVRGGTAAIADALAAEVRRLGGGIVTGVSVETLDDLPEARVVILDTTPHAAVAIAGDRLPPKTRQRYERFRYGPGVFKIDWALSGPVPWTAEELRRAATIHLGGTIDELLRSERQVATGRPPDRPFTLFGQYAAWDPHACPGRSGDRVGVLPRTRRFHDRHDRAHRGAGRARGAGLPRPHPRPIDPRSGENWNATIRITWAATSTRGSPTSASCVFRPTRGLDPYHAGEGLYLCSSSTPPGGGVHGMGGYMAARSALRRDLA